MAPQQFCPRSVLVTGTNRGLGLEIVKQFLSFEKSPAAVFATCRAPDDAKELQKLAKQHTNLHILKFDVTDYGSLGQLVERVSAVVGDRGLSLLINNAGILHRTTLDEVRPEEMRESFEVNTVAPVMITQAFLPLLRQASATWDTEGLSCSRAAIINMSSKIASVADNSSGGRYPYRASKAALNILTKSMAVELMKDNILAAALHPGWVQTDMGGPNALISSQESIKGIMTVLSNMGAEQSGSFLSFRGDVIPW